MTTLVVGSGFVGSALAAGLVAAGEPSVVASRTPPRPGTLAEGVRWMELDVTAAGAFARVSAACHADRIVLVHGPSDVTWCEEHPGAAMRGHAEAARLVAAEAGGRRLVLISTDNVFDGTASAPPDEATPTAPANAYGQAKRAAEEALAELPGATVLRVSLIYGCEEPSPGSWLNFFARCVHELRAGRQVRAPRDQWTTPVLLDDVVAVTLALLAAPGPPLLHLGGPDRVSRHEWARTIARGVGAPDTLVVPESRAEGRYASRPANSCLSSTVSAEAFGLVLPAVRGVQEGVRHLLHAAGGSGSP